MTYVNGKTKKIKYKDQLLILYHVDFTTLLLVISANVTEVHTSSSGYDVAFRSINQSASVCKFIDENLSSCRTTEVNIFVFSIPRKIIRSSHIRDRDKKSTWHSFVFIIF